MSDFWTACLEQIKNDTPRDVFQTWFADLTADVELEAGSITILAPSGAKLRTVRDSYGTTITQYVNRQAGKEMDIVWAVAQSKPQRPFAEHVEENKPDIAATGLLPNLTFENLVEGQANQMAFASALQVASSTHSVYNPLFIYGATGLGKTHLMHAIAHFVLKNNPSAAIAYVSSENFVNEYVAALRDGNIANFRKRYRNTDVLLIDDIQFFAGKERCQEEFFHTFNELFNSSKQIVLSCDKPINEVSDIEQRLVSRFGWGLSADIQAPDYETRLAILHNKLADMPEGVEIHPEVLDLLARKFTKNIRRMEGALNNLIGYATLLKTISLEKAQQLLADALMQEDETQSIDIEDIQKKTADYFKIDVSEMSGKRRPASIAMARQIAMYISRKLTTHSLQEIGKRFGGRDHGTVMHAIRVVDHSINHDENVHRAVEYLMKILAV